MLLCKCLSDTAGLVTREPVERLRSLPRFKLDWKRKDRADCSQFVGQCRPCTDISPCSRTKSGYCSPKPFCFAYWIIARVISWALTSGSPCAFTKEAAASTGFCPSTKLNGAIPSDLDPSTPVTLMFRVNKTFGEAGGVASAFAGAASWDMGSVGISHRIAPGTSRGYCDTYGQLCSVA